MTDYDVIVVGGGGAGMSAAVEAADAGARVLLVEARERLGGSTSLSGGAFYAAGTSVQRTRGIEDTASEMFRYYMILNQYRMDPQLARQFCDKSAEALEWLIEHGVEFPPERLFQSGVEGIARGHRAVNEGAGIASALEAAVSRRGIDVVCKYRCRSLLHDAGGKVLGIASDEGNATASAVVIATGGFGNSQRLLAELYPDAARAADWSWYIGVPENVGDGIEMGRALGADIVGHNRGLLLMTPGFGRDVESYPPAWLVYVNRNGQRFIDETIEYAVVGGVVRAQPNSECFAIFDEAARAEARPLVADLKNAWPNPQWEADRLRELADAGRIFKADTLVGLAEKVGIEPTALQTTLKRYNADAQAGRDSVCFKDGKHMRTVETPPFYAVRMRPAIVAVTAAGLRIDECARVLTRSSIPIVGLFAAGETTGGVVGECYCGSGNSISNAIIYGRIAGREAAHASLARPS